MKVRVIIQAVLTATAAVAVSGCVREPEGQYVPERGSPSSTRNSGKK